MGSPPTLFPAEHRALRELHAMARQLATHWQRLGERLEVEALRAGAADARELLRELNDRTASFGLHGRPAAQGVGSRLGDLRNVAGDLLLERNQALRTAVLDVVHVTTLLAYLAALAQQRDDAAFAAWHRRWEVRMEASRAALAAAVIAQAADPDGAIEPATPGTLGRAGHSLANGLGTIGEAIDGSAIGRAARRH
jgi:hypothetical protein